MAWDEIQPHINYRLVLAYVWRKPVAFAPNDTGGLFKSYIAVSEDWPEGVPIKTRNLGVEGESWSQDFSAARARALELGVSESRVPADPRDAQPWDDATANIIGELEKADE
jgi:hypothetical protein